MKERKREKEKQGQSVRIRKRLTDKYEMRHQDRRTDRQTVRNRVLIDGKTDRMTAMKDQAQ